MWPGEPLPSGPRCSKAQGPGGGFCPSSLFPRSGRGPLSLLSLPKCAAHSILPAGSFQPEWTRKAGGRSTGAQLVRPSPAAVGTVHRDSHHRPPPCARAAWIDKCRPNLLITESTYATTIRDSKRCRERDFLKKVHETVERGGKVATAGVGTWALGYAGRVLLAALGLGQGLRVGSTAFSSREGGRFAQH